MFPFDDVIMLYHYNKNIQWKKERVSDAVVYGQLQVKYMRQAMCADITFNQMLILIVVLPV